MAKQFQFDDEMTDEKVEISNEESTDMSEESLKDEPFSTHSFNFEDEVIEDKNDINPIAQDIENDGEFEDMAKTKKKKQFVWLWWHYVLLGLFALGVAFVIYIFMVTRNDGPVYGNTRCEGLSVAIEDTTLNTVEDELKAVYNTIDKVELAIECKQLKVDVYFKDKMNTKKAQEIAIDALKRVDAKLGYKKSNEEYSYVFGVHNNIAQYEVNFTLYSTNNDDFPIFGTKHVQNDEVSFTLHSVKDQTSADKAQSTLKD